MGRESSAPRTVGSRGVTEVQPAPDELDPELMSRKVLFVAGAGRSGTSTLAGIVSRLGVHVPLPEVPPDDSNPRGFSEPQWAVDVHDEWLAETLVQVSDSRPAAWLETGRVSAREPARASQRLAGPALRGPPRTCREGPATELVPGFVASRRVAQQRHSRVRNDASTAGRGGGVQAEVLRQQVGLGPPDCQLGQHAAAHRARHATAGRGW